MALEVEINLAAPDPNACPANIVELVALLDTLLTGSVIGDYLPYVTGVDEPGVEDQDKVWHRLDSGGKPIGTFLYYNGAWRREYNGQSNQMCFFHGNPDGVFDAEGRGLPETDWDGWQICNGNNGTADFSGKFLVMSKDYEAAGLGWKSDISGSPSTQGGAKDITLTDLTTYRPATNALQVGKWKADGNTPNAASGLYGQVTGVPGGDSTLIAADAGVPEPAAIPTLPPYYTTCLVMFIGYL